MNKRHITIKEAKQLPKGTVILWLKDNKHYRMASDGVFEELDFLPKSVSECGCLNGNSAHFCFMACFTIKDLYIVEN